MWRNKREQRNERTLWCSDLNFWITFLYSLFLPSTFIELSSPYWCSWEIQRNALLNCFPLPTEHHRGPSLPLSLTRILSTTYYKCTGLCRSVQRTHNHPSLATLIVLTGLSIFPLGGRFKSQHRHPTGHVKVNLKSLLVNRKLHSSKNPFLGLFFIESTVIKWELTNLAYWTQ